MSNLRLKLEEMLPLTKMALDIAWKQKGMFKDEFEDLKDIEANMIHVGKQNVSGVNNQSLGGGVNLSNQMNRGVHNNIDNTGDNN